MTKQFDFVSIGDVTTDAFIKLKEASVNCDINREKCVICMDFASKIPYESVTVVAGVGNSANAAVSAARLGLNSAFASNVGNDDYGHEAIAALAKEGVSTQFITVHNDKRTNYHYVLWFEDERTILINHEHYDYALPDIDDPRWVYFSSIGENSLDFHNEVASYLEQRPEIKLAFQPGTFQIAAGVEKLKNLYGRTELIIANKEEYQRILASSESDEKELMKKMRSLGPKITVLTDGIKGAYVLEPNGAWFMPIYPDPKPPLERTGAGDAFSSAFACALALGKSIEEALLWAPINSMSVVQHVGARAGLLTQSQIEDFLKEAPLDYKPKRI